MSWRRQMEALLCAFAARDTRYGRAQDLDSGYRQRLGTFQSAKFLKLRQDALKPRHLIQ